MAPAIFTIALTIYESYNGNLLYALAWFALTILFLYIGLKIGKSDSLAITY
ncbi:MAG: hypothetical protein ACFFAY_00820 [Promethearchaeota archaeon]